MVAVLGVGALLLLFSRRVVVVVQSMDIIYRLNNPPRVLGASFFFFFLMLLGILSFFGFPVFEGDELEVTSPSGSMGASPFFLLRLVDLSGDAADDDFFLPSFFGDEDFLDFFGDDLSDFFDLEGEEPSGRGFDLDVFFLAFFSSSSFFRFSSCHARSCSRREDRRGAEMIS